MCWLAQGEEEKCRATPIWTKNNKNHPRFNVSARRANNQRKAENKKRRKKRQKEVKEETEDEKKRRRKKKKINMS